jgi:alpha-D-xyloside xylohydrolase
MVRPNTVLPMGANEQRPDYDYADGVVFHLFELDDGGVASARVPTVSGEVALSIQVSRSGQQITVEMEGASRAWAILLRGIETAQSVDGGKAKKDPLGVLVTARKGASRLTIEL